MTATEVPPQVISKASETAASVKELSNGVYLNGNGDGNLNGHANGKLNGDSAPESSWETFSLPAFPTDASSFQPLDFLLLSWVLLLSRGSLASTEAVLTWGYCDPGSAAVPRLTAALGDVIASAESNALTVAELLAAVRKLRTKSRGQENGAANGNGEVDAEGSETGSSNGCSESYCYNFFATVEEGSSSKYLFGIKADLSFSPSKPTLRVRPSPQPHTSLSKPITAIHLAAYADILSTLLSHPFSDSLHVPVPPSTHELSHLWRLNTPVPPTIPTPMHHFISRNAASHPEKPAVQSWDAHFTYAELDTLSTLLAQHLLTTHPLPVGTPVPLLFEKSAWTPVAVLAVMKAGFCFVLTDPSQPPARLSTIASEVSATLMLSSERQHALASSIAPEGAVVLPVGPALREQLSIPETAEKLAGVQLPEVPGESPCYIIFTSGSTGKPKGVILTHANYTSGAVPRAEAVGYNSHSRVLDFASYAFDVSVDCMLATLYAGGCICVPSESQRVNDLSGAIRDMDVNMAHMTPSVARVLEPDVLPRLEVLGLGGESVGSSDAAAWSKHTRVVIAYGPSETTVGCTINNQVEVGTGYTSIGWGKGGVMWIVDPEDHDVLVPMGAIGELLVEGPIVGVGYLNMPEKTREVFIEDPKWLVQGAPPAYEGRKGRLYKTGDLVRYSPDGSGRIVFVGRKDRQVKLRGQRVELAEVEHHLRNHLPKGTSAVVEVIKPAGKGAEPTLVAFLAEQKDGKAQDEAPSFSPELQQILGEMDKALSEELPIYMVPTAYIPLKEIPLLVSCKTDRKRLHEIGASMTKQELAKYRARVAEKNEPATDMERQIHQLWRDLLGADLDIGVHDNFFALGGDSLRAMRLVAAARSVGISLTVAEIFMHPTLAEMALVAGTSAAGGDANIPEFTLLDSDWSSEAARAEAAELCNLDREEVEDVYACTPLQEGLMALSAKVSEAYVAQRVVDLPDIEAAYRLKAAFQAVSKTCPILRTRIVQIPRRGLFQVVVANDKDQWHSSNSLVRYLEQDREIPMELGVPLARFAVINDEKTGKAHITLTMHHALYDGWSMPLIVDRVNKAYQGLTTAAPTPFKAFIKYLRNMPRQDAEVYWREQLRGADGPQFPALPYEGYQTRADSLLELYVPVSRSANSSTTIATAIRGAWALVAASYAGTQDVVFGETLTGRNAPIAGVEDIEGPMITTVPVRVKINPKARAQEYLQDIHDQTVFRIPHEHMGLQHIRRLSPDALQACELRTGLVLHPNAEEQEVKASENEPANGFVPAGDAEAAREALKFNSYALMLVCSIGPDGFFIMASFDSNTVSSPIMQKALDQLARTAQQLCSEANPRLGDVQVLGEQDREEIWRLSSVGPKTLAESGKDTIRENYASATAAWIVDPEDTERLLPIGGVGELLVETPVESAAPYVETQWLAAGCAQFAGRQSRLYKTGQLAKYNLDGSIIFMGHKQDMSKKKAAEAVRQNGQKKRIAVPTPRQETLLQLWSRVLSIEQEEIGLNDSFFELGGDSIGAMKLVSEARLEGLRLTVGDVFRHRRFADMANILKESRTLGAPKEEVYKPFSLLNIPNVESFVNTIAKPALSDPNWKVIDVLPARPLQEIAVEGTVKIPRFSARYELFYFDQPVDRSKLFESCQKLVSLNEILRTVFIKDIDGRCLSVVLEDVQAPVVTYTTSTDLSAFAHDLCKLDIQTSIPYGSLFVKFFHIQSDSSNRSCLVFRISHAQYDEICLPLLLHQFSALYSSQPIPRTLPFSPFAAHVLRKNIPQSIPYWKELLQGAQMTRFRPDIPVTNTDHYATQRTFSIAGRSKESTVATLPTAAWALALARRQGLKDVVFGEVVSGRNIGFPSAELVVGPTWQYVPVRVAFQDGWTGADFLQFVQNQHVASAAHEGMGLKEIVEQCTTWNPREVEWFDTVVHQDVDHVENLGFDGVLGGATMETFYPHFEPLRELKVQAFPAGDELTIEIVTVESWKDVAEELLGEIGAALEELTRGVDQKLFA